MSDASSDGVRRANGSSGVPPPAAVSAPESPQVEAQPDDGLPPEVSLAVQRLDQIVKRFEEHPEPAVKDLAFELLHHIDTLHRAGLKRLNELLKVAGLQQRAVDDPEVRLLYDLYDLGEGGDRQRAEAVVETMRPALEALGTAVELLEAEGNRIRIRISPPPADTPHDHAAEVRAAVEHFLRDGLPDVASIDIIEDPRPQPLPSNFVPLSTLTMPRAPHWRPVLQLADVPVGALRSIEVGETRILLTNLGGGELYAYRNECPGTPFPLDAAKLTEGILLCPWHGCRFELRGGRRVDMQGTGLGVVPVRVHEDQVLVAVPQAAAA